LERKLAITVRRTTYHGDIPHSQLIKDKKGNVEDKQTISQKVICSCEWGWFE